MLAEPVGSPVELTREEAEAIVRYTIENPQAMNEEAAARERREFRRVRRESGALLVRPYQK